MILNSNLCAMYYQVGKIYNTVFITNACKFGTYEENQKYSILSSPTRGKSIAKHMSY